jgi:hypothetical protein
VQPAAGDLLAVDHTVFRNGVHPPRVLVNGRAAAPAWRQSGHRRALPRPAEAGDAHGQAAPGRPPRLPDQVVIPGVWLLAGFVPGRPGG